MPKCVRLLEISINAVQLKMLEYFHNLSLNVLDDKIFNKGVENYEF